MAMEQQKVLWIIFSVALFVLVVVGIGVIWFLPNDHQAQKAAATPASSNAKIVFDPYEWAKSDNNAYPGLEGPQPQQQQQQSKDFTLIYGQNPQTPAAPAATQPAAPVQTTPAARTTAPAAPAVQPSAPRPAPAAHPAPRNVRVQQHWIQAASYTSNFRAQEAKKTLAANGISSQVVSHDVSGTTYYRVRVGPYANQQDAEKFLGLVKQVSGFESSFLTQAYTTQSVQ